MNKEDVSKLIKIQRDYFHTGATLPVEMRIENLKKLRVAIKENQTLIEEAIKADLGRSAFATYMCEVGMALSELDFMLRHTKRYAREHFVYTPLAQMVGVSYVKPSPYGVVLIMSPWNYPFLLTIDPLIDALAAGNTAIVKPSAYAPKTSQVIEKILKDCFDPEYVNVILGGREENTALIEGDFDYIFFTGSPGVGKEVMRKAADKLIPVTLELGGKSPCIVDKTADLKVAARRIVFGKYLNCGQTCVAPDYIYCDPSIKNELIKYLIEEIQIQFGVVPLDDENYGKIVNEKHFKRILSLIDEDKVVFGGERDPQTLRISPTVMDNVTWEDPVMKEEIFGPVLPVLTYTDKTDMINTLQNLPSPLALYLFSNDNKLINEVKERLQFGGGCINDTIIQLATSEMGFGGVGLSGMGSYHGKAGFETFTHNKSMVRKTNWPDFPFRYQPYTSWKEQIVKLLLR